jgi:formylglycine-generating enzyme required for sulfatase activity
MKQVFFTRKLMLFLFAIGIAGCQSESNTEKTSMMNKAPAKENSRVIQTLSDSQTRKQPRIIVDPITGMEFIRVKSGCFNMGCNVNFDNCDKDELPMHRVCITKSFYIGKTEVTQSQWVAVMGSNPSNFKGRDNPVDNVSWDDAQNFCSSLNKKAAGNRYRLPTEAEWEYACRSGGKDQKYCGGNNYKSLGWFGDAGKKTHPVGKKKPNGLGLYDMSGNVEEWVQDVFEYGSYGSSPVQNPKGPPSTPDSSRVKRGGSWDFSGIGGAVRSTYRGFNNANNSYGGTGVRLVVVPLTKVTRNK